MPIEETALLAETIQSLSNLQLAVFVTMFTQIGLLGVLFMILRNNHNENKGERQSNENVFKMMSQIYNSFSSVTESFKREQEKDWLRTQQFNRALSELFKVQKQIYYMMGRLEKRVENIETRVFKEKDNG